MTPGVSLELEQLLQVPPLSQMLATRQVSNHKTGINQASSKGRGMEFAEVRPYLAGDDVRSIDWRITARTGKPHTKLFREERDRCVYVLLDLDPGMYFGSHGQLKARLATLVAAAASWQALAQGDKIGGIVLIGDEPVRQPPAGRRRDLLTWLHTLHQSYQQGLSRHPVTPRLCDGLKLLSQTIRPGSLVHIISDFYRTSDELWLWLRRLHKSHHVRCYQVLDHLELALHGKGSLAVDNGREEGFLTSFDSKFAQHYRQVAQHRQHQVQRHLHECCQRAYQLDAARALGSKRGIG